MIPFISFNNGVYNVKESINMNQSKMETFDILAKNFVYKYYNYNRANEIASVRYRVTREPYYYIKHDINLEEFEYDLWRIIGYYVSGEDLEKLKNPNMLQQQLDEFKKKYDESKKQKGGKKNRQKRRKHTKKKKSYKKKNSYKKKKINLYL